MDKHHFSDFDFENDIKINPSALDVEWVNQANLFYRYSEITAEAGDDLDMAKANLEVERAKADRRVRDQLEIDGMKITEAVVERMIPADEDYREAFTELNKARYTHNMCVAAVRALDHKKTALENLVRLNGQNYFAGPSVPRDLAKEVREQTRTEGRMRERTPRRTRGSREDST